LIFLEICWISRNQCKYTIAKLPIFRIKSNSDKEIIKCCSDFKTRTTQTNRRNEIRRNTERGYSSTFLVFSRMLKNSCNYCYCKVMNIQSKCIVTCGMAKCSSKNLSNEHFLRFLKIAQNSKQSNASFNQK